MRSVSLGSRLCVAVAGLVATASAAHAGAPVPIGTRALLSLSVQMDGTGQRVSKSDGVDVKWSTRRTYDAKVELAAEKPSAGSAADAKGQPGGSYKQSSQMKDLQKEAEKCDPNDMACQMELAAKMMETQDAQQLMQEAQKAQAAPARYQPWKAPAKGGRVELKGDYMEQWDGVFLTATREERHCTLVGKYPGNGASAKDRDTMESGAKGLNVEVDTQTGKAWLMLAGSSFSTGELKCHVNDGGRVSDNNEPKVVPFTVPIDIKATGGWSAGTAGTGAVIASGELNFDAKAADHSGEAGLTVNAPLKVKVRWELTRL